MLACNNGQYGGQTKHLQINSFVALRDLDGLPVASNLPYFFFDDVDVDNAELMLFDEMRVDEKELESFTVLFDSL